jgi:aspartyl-tRNA(Asn)/glutamyl-tRNA(Gln) amidotransferase subunit A
VTSDTPTIEEFGRKLRAREISTVEITDDCLKRIDADNGRLNAFILVMTDEARRQARDADRELAAGRDRGPLHGVPVSIKDLFDIRGTATSAASLVREGHIADRDAPVIAHLRRAGAVLIGKTNLHEFAFGTTNEDSAFGPDRLADRAADRRRAWPLAWRWRRSGQTPADRSEFRPPLAEPSA